MPTTMPTTIDVRWNEMQRSTLMKTGGMIVLDDLVSRDRCRALLQEARSQTIHATQSNVTTIDTEEIRGGNPTRRFVSSAGSDTQMCFYQCRSTIARLSELCGTQLQPTGKCGTYTYYRPGDFLSLHRDIETCDVSVITCLLDNHAVNSRGGTTVLYPQRCAEPLSRIRATSRQGARRLRLAVGSTLVFLGGQIPHLIETLGPQDFRIVSILCYRLASESETSSTEDCGCGCS